MTNFVQKYLKEVTYAVGYDITAESDKKFIENLILACRDDMLLSGVHDTVIDGDKFEKIILSTLVIFVTDNQKVTGGDFKTSAMYLNNVDKLRVGSINAS